MSPCLPDPTSFFIPASWPTCIPWAPGANRIGPRWQAANLQTCGTPSSSKHLQQHHNHCYKVQVAPCKEKKRHQHCLSVPSCWEKKLEGISRCLRESLMHGRVCPSSAPWLHPVQRNKRMSPTAVKVKLCLEIWPKLPSLSSESVKKEELLHKDNQGFSSSLCVFCRVLIYHKFKILLGTTLSPKHSEALGHERHWKTFFSQIIV